MQADFDIAICGAGPVGLALAALLAQHGVAAARIAVIDAKTLEQAAADPRSIALSYGSRQLLEQIGAWPRAATEIHQIHVSRRGRFGRTLIDRADHALPALGYVTRYGALVDALSQRAAADGIALIRPAQVAALDEQPDAVALELAGHDNIRAGIVVQAEGGVFTDQAAKVRHRDYRQTAIVAHVTTERPLPHRAFERFTDEGPLALLPQDDGYALVWCTRPETAAHLLALTGDAFLAELTQAFGGRLGRFVDISPRNAFPLGLNAQPSSSGRTVAIGNAAQTLHPVAGQGLNLGLRDAAVLARLLARDAAPAALKDFAQARHADRSITIRLTDAMARIFASTPGEGPLQTILGVSLGIVDAIAPAKKMLAEQMMFGQRR